VVELLVPLAAAGATGVAAHVVERRRHHPRLQMLDLAALPDVLHGTSKCFLDGIFGPVARSCEEGDSTDDAWVAVLDQVIELVPEGIVSVHHDLID
jgi:hypothetical protein